LRDGQWQAGVPMIDMRLQVSTRSRINGTRNSQAAAAAAKSHLLE
jgi:hypothetical protein